MQTSSVAGLALFLVAFTRATLVGLCSNENHKIFCLAKLPNHKFYTFTFYHLKSHFVEVLS